jgi:RHS repeat-associated protein
MGHKVQQYAYDSFGNIKFTPFPHWIKQPYTYTGREFDHETGLYYYRARYYDPKAGRFVTKDPIGFDGGDYNLFVYVGNNPVNFVDPMGLYNPFGANPQKPGCDFFPDFNKCATKCCKVHDDCYKKNGCNMLSWNYTGLVTQFFSKCAKCNIDAVKCLAKAAIKCDECE